jgi:hypothetical protein
MKVEPGRLRAVLGIREVDFVATGTPLAVVDSPLAG